MISRRRFFTGLIAAPIVMQASSLMPLRGIGQGDEHGMRSDACVHFLQFAAPPGEQAQAFLRVADFVR